jgi:hypothetical protein
MITQKARKKRRVPTIGRDHAHIKRKTKIMERKKNIIKIEAENVMIAKTMTETKEDRQKKTIKVANENSPIQKSKKRFS